MKLLITGALGHIGSCFIRSLRPDDYQQVILLDNLATQRYCSLFNLPEGVPFRFVEADICSADLTELFAGVDVVLHLAAHTNAVSSVGLQEIVERVNYQGTQRVAQACATCGCKLLFPSTTSVYTPQAEQVDEDCSPEELEPTNPYTISKRQAEQYLQMAAGLQFVVCRFGTIFGTSVGMQFHTAINKFVWQACMGIPLTVWRTALDQKRPYLDLNDAVRAIHFIIAHDIFDNRLYNVLTTNTTVREVVAVIRQFIPDLSIQLVESSVMNQLSYEVSNQRFRALGFKFQGRVEDSIRDTFQLLKNARQSAMG